MFCCERKRSANEIALTCSMGKEPKASQWSTRLSTDMNTICGTSCIPCFASGACSEQAFVVTGATNFAETTVSGSKRDNGQAVCACVHVCTQAFSCVCVCTYVWVHACMCVCMHVWVYACVCVCVHAHVRVHACSLALPHCILQ